MSIWLEGTENTSWLRNGEATRSIPRPRYPRSGPYLGCYDNYYPDYDYEIVLFPFYFLQNVREIEIFGTDEFEKKLDDPLIDIAEDIRMKRIRTTFYPYEIRPSPSEIYFRWI